MTALRQTADGPHACLYWYYRVSRQQVYHPFSPSLTLSSFILPVITQHTESFNVFLQCFFLHCPSNLPLCFLGIIYNNYFPYNLCLYLFSFFFFVWSILYWKKRIKKDFVIATSKYNEMLSLLSMHKFVLFINWFFFSYVGLYRFYTEQNYLLKFR